MAPTTPALLTLKPTGQPLASPDATPDTRKCTRQGRRRRHSFRTRSREKMSYHALCGGRSYRVPTRWYCSITVQGHGTQRLLCCPTPSAEYRSYQHQHRRVQHAAQGGLLVSLVGVAGSQERNRATTCASEQAFLAPKLGLPATHAWADVLSCVLATARNLCIAVEERAPWDMELIKAY